MYHPQIQFRKFLDIDFIVHNTSFLLVPHGPSCRIYFGFSTLNICCSRFSPRGFCTKKLPAMEHLIEFLPWFLGSCTNDLLKEADEELISACTQGDTHKVQRLIRHRNVNIRDSEGKTPLHHASRHGNVESVILLMLAASRWNMIGYSI